jgi:hypothetical protein
MWTNPAAAAWVQAVIYTLMLAVLAWQILLLRRQVEMQWRALRDAEYLRCQMDFTETLRLLVRTRLHSRVYDALERTGKSKFERWSTYSRDEKAEYAYFELLYELLERIFVVRTRGDIDEREWRQWEGWIGDVIDNRVFADVHADNTGMFDPDFELYVGKALEAAGARSQAAAQPFVKADAQSAP